MKEVEEGKGRLGKIKGSILRMDSNYFIYSLLLVIPVSILSIVESIGASYLIKPFVTIGIPVFSQKRRMPRPTQNLINKGRQWSKDPNVDFRFVNKNLCLFVINFYTERVGDRFKCSIKWKNEDEAIITGRYSIINMLNASIIFAATSFISWFLLPAIIVPIFIITLYYFSLRYNRKKTNQMIDKIERMLIAENENPPSPPRL